MRIITLSQLSLAGSSGIAEAKIPLWWADGTTLGVNSTSGSYICDGGSVNASATTNSASQLFTLSPTWSATQSYAFEASIYVGSAGTGYAELWDITASALVSSSTVSTTSTSESVLRSGKFTLTPSHSYAVRLRTSASMTVYISDASLIIFPS